MLWHFYTALWLTCTRDSGNFSCHILLRDYTYFTMLPVIAIMFNIILYSKYLLNSKKCGKRLKNIWLLRNITYHRVIFLLPRGGVAALSLEVFKGLDQLGLVEGSLFYCPETENGALRVSFPQRNLGTSKTTCSEWSISLTDAQNFVLSANVLGSLSKYVLTNEATMSKTRRNFLLGRHWAISSCTI